MTAEPIPAPDPEDACWAIFLAECGASWAKYRAGQLSRMRCLLEILDARDALERCLNQIPVSEGSPR